MPAAGQSQRFWLENTFSAQHGEFNWLKDHHRRLCCCVVLVECLRWASSSSSSSSTAAVYLGRSKIEWRSATVIDSLFKQNNCNYLPQHQRRSLSQFCWQSKTFLGAIILLLSAARRRVAKECLLQTNSSMQMAIWLCVETNWRWLVGCNQPLFYSISVVVLFAFGVSFVRGQLRAFDLLCCCRRREALSFRAEGGMGGWTWWGEYNQYMVIRLISI